MTERTGFRIIEHPPRDGSEHLRAVHEVRYDEHGRPVSFVGIPVEIAWLVHDGDEAGVALLERVRQAFNLPVLKVSDFPRTPPNEKKPA
ncbi:hypothetical protein [Paraburkholderia sp. J10-1]|uniref:hypothetical protein n=1 Tax=Paraburkholderia sp. J10-1 TaxID=2805430 RepID=UPI002AB72D27|nr:hypothetical protein [Paraburkholderia sp. J10-1]